MNRNSGARLQDGELTRCRITDPVRKQKEEEEESMPSPSVLHPQNPGPAAGPHRPTARSRKRKADVAVQLQDPDEEVTEMSRKKQCPPETASCWRSCGSAVSPPDPEGLGGAGFRSVGFSHYAERSLFSTPTRPSPLPALCWGNKDDVWNNLLKKDKLYQLNIQVMQKHPNLQPKMRAILLDWLMEVCEVYKLQRESYYLAQSYFDRFMSTQENIQKTTLQLIGISALFIAAKMEEIYPPKVHQFAYVTDGACTEDEILSMEVIMMKELNWSLSPLTPLSWLNIYMQMAYLKEHSEVLKPQFPQNTFVHIAELVDLCVLDIRSLEFSCSVLAAAALFHFSSMELVAKVSGLNWVAIEDCVRWMIPFAMAIREIGSSTLKTFKGIPAESAHSIQTHAAYLDWLEKVAAHRQVDLEHSRSASVPPGVLTPPPSSEKPEGGAS